MSEQTKTQPGLLKRWLQAVSRFITFCLYGNGGSPGNVAAKQARAELQRQLQLEEEALRMRARGFK